MSDTILTSFLKNSFQAFDWGPITTLFVPPPTCSQILTSQTNNGNLFVGHNGQNNFDPDCYPTGSVGSSRLEVASNWNLYYYSPAICPSGWITATTFTDTFLGLGPVLTEAIVLGTDTTAALCCPRSFTYDSIGHACASEALVGQTVSYILLTQAGLSQARGTVTTSSVRSLTSVQCDGVPIWWQASDQAVLYAASQITPTTSAASTNTALSSSSTSGSSLSSPTSKLSNSTSSASPSSGISPGGKAAIGIFIPLIFISILAGLIYFFRIRKKRAMKARQEVEYYVPEQAPSDKQWNMNQYELWNVHNRPVEIYTEYGAFPPPPPRPELGHQ